MMEIMLLMPKDIRDKPLLRNQQGFSRFLIKKAKISIRKSYLLVFVSTINCTSLFVSTEGIFIRKP